MARLLHDGHRFARLFFEVIAISAYHIYQSALPFAPDCLLRDTYLKTEDSVVSVISGRDSNWGACLRVIQIPSEAFSVKLSLDGSTIVSGSDDAIVRVWDVASGEILKVLEGHTDSIACVALSANGSIIASGSNDLTIRLWDLTSGETLAVLEGRREER